jgi:toxin ParE1/3/4
MSESRFELSEAAERDLTEIYIYTHRNFGAEQAEAYLLSLDDCFHQLAQFRDIGRSIEHLRSGYFRFEHASHTVFYVKIADGVRIVRVLHQAMDPERHV